MAATNTMKASTSLAFGEVDASYCSDEVQRGVQGHADARDVSDAPKRRQGGLAGGRWGPAGAQREGRHGSQAARTETHTRA